MLPQDCVSTVGWMQQHQREKPTPRASIDSTANLLLFCESRRQCSNRLEFKKVCSLMLRSIIQAAEWGETAAAPPPPSLSLSPRFYSAGFLLLWKAEHKWNLLIFLLALSLCIPYCISLQHSSTCSPLILHHHSSSERLLLLLLLLLVAPFRSPPVLSDCCSITPCIVWQTLETTLSQLHRGTHTHTRIHTEQTCPWAFASASLQVSLWD